MLFRYYLRILVEKKEKVLESIDSQGLLTDELKELVDIDSDFKISSFAKAFADAVKNR